MYRVGLPDPALNPSNRAFPSHARAEKLVESAATRSATASFPPSPLFWPGWRRRFQAAPSPHGSRSAASGVVGCRPALVSARPSRTVDR